MRCLCRVFFGGDGKQKVVGSQEHLYEYGQKITETLKTAMEANSVGKEEKFRSYPLKTYHILGNTYDHAYDHHIDPHSDKSSTYHKGDPITSLSWGALGLIEFTPVDKNQDGQTFALENVTR